MGARMLFLSGVGLVYVLAFASYLLQFPGVHGQNGLEPIDAYFARIKSHVDISDVSSAGDVSKAVAAHPSLLWLAEARGIDCDSFVEVLCGLGVLAGGLVAGGWHSPVLLAYCWVAYLTLLTSSQSMMSFQWDILILECGFLSIFYAVTESAAMRWTLRLLAFKFFLMTGCVKVQSGCPTWRNLTALKYHYASQCIPTPLAYYASLLPAWANMSSLAFVLFTQLVGPFLLVSPLLHQRRLGVLLQLVSMAGIQLTGNYNWFNLHAALLVLPSWEGELEDEEPADVNPRLAAGGGDDDDAAAAAAAAAEEDAGSKREPPSVSPAAVAVAVVFLLARASGGGGGVGRADVAAAALAVAGVSRPSKRHAALAARALPTLTLAALATLFAVLFAETKDGATPRRSRDTFVVPVPDMVAASRHFEPLVSLPPAQQQHVLEFPVSKVTPLLLERVLGRVLPTLFAYFFLSITMSWVVRASTVSAEAGARRVAVTGRASGSLVGALLVALAAVFASCSLSHLQEVHAKVPAYLSAAVPVGPALPQDLSGSVHAALRYGFAGYGLFRRMTGVGANGEVAVPVVVLEHASGDDGAWTEVRFRYHPGDVARSPPWVAPHQPRMDWRLWFAALGNMQSDPWLVHLSAKIVAGEEAVLALLDPSSPLVRADKARPDRVRATVYHYRFAVPGEDDAGSNATAGAGARARAWWVRRKAHEWHPAIAGEAASTDVRRFLGRFGWGAEAAEGRWRAREGAAELRGGWGFAEGAVAEYRKLVAAWRGANAEGSAAVAVLVMTLPWLSLRLLSLS